jgi:hypothetical protein
MSNGSHPRTAPAPGPLYDGAGRSRRVSGSRRSALAAPLAASSARPNAYFLLGAAGAAGGAVVLC